MIKQRIFAAIVGASLLVGAVALAQQQRPKITIGKGHPKLMAAQESIQTAWDKVTEAWNYYKAMDPHDKTPFGGHAAKAKLLLEQADQELKLAAETVNGFEKKK